jgi:parvulin-like peptidyl-prolyl isomerase
MALMTDIRNNLTKLFAVLAVLFIVLIVFDWGMDLPQLRPGFTGDIVGKVNRKELTYREFSELLRQQVEAYRAQAGTDPDEDTERFLRDQVWNTFVQQSLMSEQIEKLGIDVTDKEIIDLVHGPNPPEFLMRNFRDSTGTFNRAAYDRAIADPQNREAWVQVEKVLREQRKQEKLQSLLLASVRVTEEELKQRFIDQNTTLEAEYLLFDPARFYPDSVIPVTDEDIRKHYNENPEEFKVRPARRIKYVQFSLVPSREDTLAVVEEINRLHAQAKSGTDFLELAKTFSDVPVNEAFFKHGELSRAKETPLFSAKKGDIVGPVADYDGYHLLKVLDERQGTATYVRASHILLNAVAGPDSVKKIQLARDLLRQIRNGADFAELAKKYSEDISSASQGGELGWNTKGAWVKPFEEAAFRARVGEVIGPVRSQFGWHIIKVTGRDNRELKIAALTLRLKPSSQTTETIYKLAEDFSYLAKSEGFEKAAEFSKYDVRETPDFVKTGTIPGLGFSDAVMNFAFNSTIGAVSNPISLRGIIVVAKLTGIREEGVQPLQDVKNIVTSMVLRKKKMEKLRPRVEEFANNLQPTSDLAMAAKAMPEILYQKTGPFKPLDPVAQIGRDLAFIGTALALRPGELSKPFEGQRGYYLVKLIAKSPFDSTKFSTERTTLRDQLLQEKRNQVLSQWFTTLREHASIEDNREKFFR